MAALDREELQRRLTAARKLDPNKPGGASKETVVATMEAVLADAEALGDPEMLFKARIDYGYTMRWKSWEDSSSEQVIAEVLGVLRKCLLAWHATRTATRRTTSRRCGRRSSTWSTGTPGSTSSPPTASTG
ncbi:hypothetical protein [Actinomadura sp. CNU-125]|uniref:hypothetical protein n=1 Tax=Actinomadura sp. CNU-125 TaxID=1904961 RepID=UPI001178218C|nr:hypothetical protein [Actinomadura sp. CNU-125]